MATILPNPAFSAADAAKTLQKAMKGLGTDEKTIINVLSTHNAAQRLEIAASFEAQFKKNLTGQLKSETKGKFQEALVALMDTCSTYLARELRQAMKGPGTDETVLIEILCARKNHEIDAIKEAYTRTFKRDLCKDVVKETSGQFGRLLLKQCQADRDEGNDVDPGRATADAEALNKAGAGRFGTNESVFNEILCDRSYAHLRVVFRKYAKLAGHEIEVAIKKETSGMLRFGYLTIVSYVRDSNAFFAYRLYHSMKGLGTDDDTLIRIVISRSEIDLARVAEAFTALYKSTLSAFIRGDCRGDYKNLLLAVVGGR